MAAKHNTRQRVRSVVRLSAGEGAPRSNGLPSAAVPLALVSGGTACTAVQRVSRTLQPEMTMLKMKWDQCILWKSLHGRRAKENEAQVRFRCAAPRRNRGAQDGLWPQWLAWPPVPFGVPHSAL